MESPARLPVTTLKGVGPQLAAKLERLGIHSVVDLLFHLPSRYQDRTKVFAIGELAPGAEALVQGRIEASGVRFGRRRSLITVISDDTGQLSMRQFHFSAAQQRGLSRGQCIQCYGEVRAGPAGLEMVHPEYRLIESLDAGASEEALTPVYPTTEGIGQARWRDLTLQALRQCGDQIPELLPAELVSQFDQLPLASALQLLHRPPPDIDLETLQSGAHPAQRRLSFEEMLAHHLAVRQRRERRNALRALPIRSDGSLWKALQAHLEFSLTAAQQRCVEEILTDIAKSAPSLRLLQGDVGSGKTIVAAAAILAAVESGQQAVVMAPTELLAEQHFRTFQKWLARIDLQPDWLTGRLKIGRAHV